MNHQCKTCQADFEVTPEDMDFYDKVSPVFNGVKQLVPPPINCPTCRYQRRLMFINEFYLYSESCALCSKHMLSQIDPSSGRKSFCRDCWTGDGHDPLDYGRDFDFNRPFFEQFKELLDVVPFSGQYVSGTLENSDYVQCAGSLKNCYLIMHADHNEDCYYGYGIKHCTNCVDGYYNFRSELCYDSTDCHDCYGLTHCQDCSNTRTSAFLYDCIGCTDCFASTGLRNKQFYFENKQLTETEYKAKMATIDLASHSQYQAWVQRLDELKLAAPHKEYHGYNIEASSGDYLINCKNVTKSFDCEDVENGKFCIQTVTGAKDVYDIYQFGFNLELSYQCVLAGEGVYHALFCSMVNTSVADVYYSILLESCKDCFGCTNLDRKQYCILNKQYTKEEYEALVPRIIEHMQQTAEWGQFFPPELSPFSYNRCDAIEFITDDVPDDILNWAIVCEVSGKPFKLTAQELRFYRDHRLPIPRRMWLERFRGRLAKRNPRAMHQRECGACAKAITTTYAPDRPENVLCEPCYLGAVN